MFIPCLVQWIWDDNLSWNFWVFWSLKHTWWVINYLTSTTCLVYHHRNTACEWSSNRWSKKCRQPLSKIKRQYTSIWQWLKMMKWQVKVKMGNQHYFTCQSDWPYLSPLFNTLKCSIRLECFVFDRIECWYFIHDFDVYFQNVRMRSTSMDTLWLWVKIKLNIALATIPCMVQSQHWGCLFHVVKRRTQQ